MHLQKKKTIPLTDSLYDRHRQLQLQNYRKTQGNQARWFSDNSVNGWCLSRKNFSCKEYFRRLLHR